MRRVFVSIAILTFFVALFSVAASQTVPSQQANQTQMQISSTAPLAPPPIEWNKTYGGSSFDILHSAIQTSDGGYALAGQRISGSYEYFWLVRTDESGNMLWNKTYGSTNSEAYSIIQTADGGFVLAGVSSNYGYVVRTNSAGTVIGTPYQDPTSGTGFYSVTKTLDGQYAVAGWAPMGWPIKTEDFLLEKLDSSLNNVWWQTFGQGSVGGSDRAWAVIQASDGGYVLVGYTNTYTMGDADAWLIKTDSGGHPEWDRKYGGADWDEFVSVIEPASGEYLAGGMTWLHGPSSSFNPWLLMCTRPGGYISTGRLWDIAYNSSNYGNYVNSIVKADGGGYVIASDDSLGAVDSGGNLLWVKKFPSISGGGSSVVIKTRDDSYAFAGTKKIDVDNTDFYLAKVDIEPVGISGPIYEPTNPPPYVPSPVPRQKEPVRVRAIMYGVRTLSNVETALLYYRVNSDRWCNTTMSYNETSEEWIGIIPGQPGSATVDFYVEGRLGPSSKASAPITYTVESLSLGDLDGDGDVDYDDILIFVSAYIDYWTP